jgi:hypothetical protein
LIERVSGPASPGDREESALMRETVAKGREDVDWAGFAREVSESAGL